MLAQTIDGARLVTIPMGHALPPAILGPLAEAIVAHTLVDPNDQREWGSSRLVELMQRG